MTPTHRTMAHTAGMYARWSASLPLLTALITAGIALSSGCSSVVTGNAVKSGGPAPAAANAALLDPGNYPRRPRPPLGNVADDAAGHRVEAQRMADMVTGPWQIDDKLISPTNAEIAPTTAISDPGRLSVLVRGETIAPIATAHHFVAGFVSGRATPPPPKGQADSDNPKILDNGVLRFPTTQDAADAAAAMGAADLATVRPGNIWATRLPIPRYPAAVADVAALSGGFEAESFTAHGPYVFFQFAGSKESAAAAADMIAKTLDLQGPSADHFQATPVDQLASLPADPTGLLARTVPATEPSINQSAVYSPHASLHFRSDPIATQAMYNDAGIARVAVDRTTVYEAVDTTGAQRAADGLVRIDVPFLGYHSAPGINGLPSARCFDRGSDSTDLGAVRFLCIATAERYAFKATAAQEVEAHQVIAAQYLMLTTS
ncbi:hypothetical protein MYCODSM44623_05643 (plasmid) [Mycobacterium intracellulare subsp. chimaera]|uniref:Uncharacterized protein n=4 Tax=Mycobacteriaceae TaxID=1762 RepID=A0A7U5RZI8_MYCIT|nr:hypothetical protein MYCODSM44623_05643 [Mycobacterium intracellulare subsp. chimaera]ASL18264.1 hypothetical protein MYCOZU2_05919 [Mycobacterium intracellulare subsp. chimaera]